ncbi:MAG: conjugal transfer protein TraC [Chloroflexota bacterium]|nr:conjugal transfer protein TraC [Chloroflexota bacterium]
MMSRRVASAADLLPVLDVGTNHFVNTDGRYGAVLESSGINMHIKSAEGADSVAALVRDLIDFLDPDTHLQLQLEGSQIHAEQWAREYRSEFNPPPGLEGYVDRTCQQLRKELEGRTVTRLRYHATVTIPGPPKPKLPRAIRRKLCSERVLARESEEHSKTLVRLDNVVSETSNALGALELTAERLGSRELIEKLWSCGNPNWSRDVTPPYEPASSDDLRCLRDRLAQSRVVVYPDYLRVDGTYQTTMVLRALPTVTYAGCMDKLAAVGFNFRAALHIDALDTNKERAALEGAHTRRHNVLAERQEKGKSTDFRTRAALEELGAIPFR